MRVALITTGKMEIKALPKALDRLFPGHDFDAPAMNQRGDPFPGFTSSRVRSLAPEDPLGKAGKLLQEALVAISPETPGASAADIALVLDDLELANCDNDAVVVAHMRSSAARLLQDAPDDISRRKRASLLRERISFHLAVPMPESWIFGDPAGAVNAGVPGERPPPKLTPDRDPEQFLTDDQQYLDDDGHLCEAWIARGSRPDWAPPWVSWGERRSQHPKAYLAWLMREPRLTGCHCYSETKQGVRALKRLNWSSVLSHPEQFPYLRALVRDLEAALGTPAVGILGGGQVAPLTAVKSANAHPLLRNL